MVQGRVVVTAPNRADLLADIEGRFRDRRGFAVATINLDHVVKLRANPAFLKAYLAQTHVTADGNPIVWLSRMAGETVELIPGSDLVGPVAAIAARTDTPVALFGSTDAALAAAADVLMANHPGLRVVLKLSPPMGFDPAGPQADAAIAQIRASGARLCYLALGAPKQEIFAARALAALPEVGFLSIGAGLDFLAGSQRRAPWVFRKLALEWLWRLGSNPSRLAGRYASCVAVLPGLAATAIRARPSRSASIR
jgi:exopolysaccharide biosynthesis WecB/TagA/CpsF family protein